jgi:hypothetical protein
MTLPIHYLSVCVCVSCAMRAALAARALVVDKLDMAVEKLSNEEDEKEFVESYKVR